MNTRLASRTDAASSAAPAARAPSATGVGVRADPDARTDVNVRAGPVARPEARPRPSSVPTVSVVVPSYNRRAGLERLLSGLARQTHPASDFEVVVVDDGSADGTPELLRGFEAPFHLAPLSQPNGGPAAARNRGVEHARGRLLLFLDDDVSPLPELIAAHVAAHAEAPSAEGDRAGATREGADQAGADQAGADQAGPDRAGAARRVVVGPMSPPRGWPRPAWVRWEEQQLQKQYDAMIDGRFECSPRQFYTGNASLARELFLAAGGFDPRFKRAEDVELAFRLSALGAEFVFEPRADVTHYASRGFDAWRRTPYQYGRYDVVMEREKGVDMLQLAAHDFHYRHAFSRRLVRLCVGHPARRRLATVGLASAALVADAVRLDRVASVALSGLFNLLYWQGASDELGGTEAVWRAVAEPFGEPAPR